VPGSCSARPIGLDVDHWGADQARFRTSCAAARVGMAPSPILCVALSVFRITSPLSVPPRRVALHREIIGRVWHLFGSAPPAGPAVTRAFVSNAVPKVRYRPGPFWSSGSQRRLVVDVVWISISLILTTATRSVRQALQPGPIEIDQPTTSSGVDQR